MKPFCARCKEEFPVAKEPTSWTMGKLRRLSKAPRRFIWRDGLREWKGNKYGGYLCGNCYFDMLDAEEGL